MATARRTNAPDRVQEGLQRLGIQPTAWERYRPSARAGQRGGEGSPQAALRVEGNEVFLEGPIIPPDDEWIMEWLGITAYVTAGLLRTALAKVEGEAVLVVNSPGGDVFEAAAIVDLLIEREAPVDIRVSGLAASAAAGLLFFCRAATCSPMAMVMFHRAWTFALGNSVELQATARLLDKVDGQLAEAMERRIEGLTREGALAILAGPEGQDGTWYTASEAVEAGFANAVTGMPEEDPEQGGDHDDREMMERMRARSRAAHQRRAF